MADQKISELTAITGANTADDDVLVIVDTSASQTKKITLGELENALAERDFTFGDNDKLVFGAGSDLQIYHDGSNSYIHDGGTGDLRIRGGNDIHIRTPDDENYIVCNQNGSVQLFYDGSAKLDTTSTGIDVTGNALASDTFEIDSGGNGFLVGGGQTGTTAIGKLHNSSGVLTLDTDGTRSIQFSTGGSAMMRVDGNGNGIIINDSGADEDFRVETLSYANALLIDASTNKTYINTPNAEIASKLTINNHNSSTGHLQFQTAFNEQANDYVRANVVFSRDNDQIFWDDTNDEWVHAGGSSTDWTMMTHTSGEFRLFHGPSYSTETRWSNSDFKTNFKVMEASNSNGWQFEAPQGGGFVFNERGLNRDFRIESAGASHMLFVDASANKIGINDSTPQYTLDITGNVRATSSVILGDSAGTAGVLSLNDTSTTAYLLNFKGTGTRGYMMEGSASSGNYNLTMTNAGTGLFGLTVDGYGSFKQTADTGATVTIGGHQDGRLINFQSGGATRFYLYGGGTGDDQLAFYESNGDAMIHMYDSEGVVINEDGTTQDFRVEADSYSNAIWVDASSGNVNFDGARTNFGGINVDTADGEINAGLVKLRNSNTTSGEFLSVDAEGTSAGQSMIHYWYDGAYRNRFEVAGNTGETVANESGLDVDFRVESDGNANMFWVDASNDTVVLNGSGTSTTGVLYINSYTSGDEPMVKIDRGGGSHKGSGILISGANYTNGTDSNAAFLAMNGGSYSTSLTKMIHAYDNGGSYFIVQGDGKTSFGHGNTAGATIDVVADSNAEAIDVRGRSSDNIGEINFRPNGGGQQYARVDGRPDAARGLGLHAYNSRDIQFGVNGAERHRIIGQKAASYSNHQRYGSLLNGAQTYGQWVDTRSSPSGGDVSAQIFSDCYGEWIVVAKWANNSSLATSVTSADQISTTTSQVSSNELSSAWGDSYPTEVRYISASDFGFWRDTRVIDFIHGVPSGRPWKLFWSSGNTSNFNVGGDNWSNSGRRGWDCTYCYDGFGRWHNPNYSFHRNIDSASHTANVSSAFTTSGTAYTFGTSDDAKFSCHKTAASSGQDAEYSQQWGRDDTNSIRYEDYPAVGSNGGSTNQSSYNLWVLIKIAPNGEV